MAIEIFADDGVIAGFDDRDQMTADAFGALVLAHVDQHIHRADEDAGVIEEGRRKRHERHPGAVGPLRNRLRRLGLAFLPSRQSPSGIGRAAAAFRPANTAATTRTIGRV